MTDTEYQDLVRSLQQAAAAYYGGDTPLIDDPTYDRGLQQLRDFETAHPHLADPHSPTQTVGAPITRGIRHARPMLSLDNLFTSEDLTTWIAGVEGSAHGPVTFVTEPKLDGLALSVTYVNGTLTRILTRGDGETGEDVTYAAPLLTTLPTELSQPLTGEVRGEALFTKQQFADANEARTSNADPAFVNARNGAAGALRGAADRTYPLPLTFYAYDFVTDSGSASHTDTLRTLTDAGLTVSLSAAGGPLPEDPAAAIAALLERRPTLDVDIDGAVIKVDDATQRNTLGYTARAPRWAIAYKYPADTAFTRLVDVTWQVGRTGTITPRATVEPVTVGGVTITHATLHNPDDIARRGFMIGDIVSIYRAGDVIPRIEAPLIDKRDGTQSPIQLPNTCPDCGGPIDRSDARWRCQRGRSCGLARWILYACSRDALDIEGLGGTHVGQLVDRGLVTDPADLFILTPQTLSGLDRFGDRSAANVMAQIDKARQAPLHRVYTALGLRGTGRTLSRRMAAALGSLQALADATTDDLLAIDGIGEEKARLIAEEVLSVRDVINKLIAHGVGATAPADPATGGGSAAVGPLAGQIVCVTGTIPGMSRTQAQEAVEALGGKPVGSVSKNTTLLVAGDGAGSKLTDAEKLGVPVMDADTFASLVSSGT